MAISVWCEIVCSVCAKTAEGRHVHGGKVPVRRMIDEAKRRGWLFTQDDAFMQSRFMTCS